MAQLVTANQFQLQANPMQALSSGLQVSNQLQQAIQAPQIQRLQQAAAQGDQNALSQLAGLAPQKARQLQQFQLGQTQATQVADEATKRDFVNFAITLKNTPPEQRLRILEQRKADLARRGRDTSDTDFAIQATQEGRHGDLDNMLNTIEQVAVRQGLIDPVGSGRQQASLKTSAPITDPETGQVSIPTIDPNTGQTRLVPVEGAIQETPQQKRERELKLTRGKKRIELTEKRISTLKTEFGERNRLAARSKRKIAEAQALASRASQGLAGVSKVQLGRVFPGIDTSNEAALVGAFKGLALDELQKFKGPTTDFEFRVTEDIAGSLGDGASANKARLASLERATWFAQRESDQFNRHIKDGHDPDQFAFNFNELVTPKKGGPSYTLQQLQDTAVHNHISIDEVIKRLSK